MDPAKPGSEPPAPLQARESTWTWGYFFAADDKDAVLALFGDRPKSLNRYRVEKVVAVRGKAGVSLKPNSALIRLESPTRLPTARDAKSPTLLFQGVPQHLQYTTGEQRADLNRRSRAELPAGQDAIAVIIPIRKSAAWWSLPHDQRNAFFHKQDDKQGHTAIGAKYVERIYRKLYHTRYAVETTEHDFITYFEFERKHTEDFQHLLAQLRDPQQNPEWRYVDREYEIWLAKLE
jgi:hypothetical protein